MTTICVDFKNISDHLAKHCQCFYIVFLPSIKSLVHSHSSKLIKKNAQVCLNTVLTFICTERVVGRVIVPAVLVLCKKYIPKSNQS